ncbi:ADP-ribosylation/Crystallin J1 [Collybia nuda]|uniref:ADP-ribosylhydrolase ARH3 n=1 Tax=Collybia nuda TaxID=64659 RepID=A0A9P5XTV3_9AGAR|nr:ADP-ribosylation/Crystallin J1 [Collybia nuda]
MVPLRTQNVTYDSAASKIRQSMLATAMVDALGGPPEFHKRFSFRLVTTMTPNKNFNLPPGVWTDDTSMTLCLARSLARYTPPSQEGHQPRTPGGFDERDQLEAYTSWRELGTLSAIGRCFDIGNTISRALTIYMTYTTEEPSANITEAALCRIRDELGGEECSGNGSLMRILPIGLVYWHDEATARSFARRSSVTTHPNSMCMEACEVWTGMIVRVMQNSGSATQYTKLDLVEYLANFQYSNETLQKALALPIDVPSMPSKAEERESYYHKHHPILRLIARTQPSPPTSNTGFSKNLPSEKELPSSGYVLHTMVAALYCFFATETFEEGAIMAVNLGSDADTVGAIYAGLAGCWYSGEEDAAASSAFWTSRVKKWRDELVKRELVEEVADELVRLRDRMQYF